MIAARVPAVWFPAVRTGTGTDVFTERLAAGLNKRGIRAEIAWLPLRAEYAPWTVRVPRSPEWATVAHVSTWLHPRFLPRNLPVVATIHHSVHDPALRAYKGFARAAYHRWWISPNERCVLKHADVVVAVSQFVADMARRTLVDVPMEVIYNGVNTNKFKPGNGRRQSGKPFRLLYVGSWTRRKGVDLLAPIMRELGNGFELHYTGGPTSDSDKPGMPANMRDIGRLQGDDSVIAAMQDADALLFPSRSEGHPLVVIEAMACNLPVIAARGPSLEEVVENGVTGSLCPQDNVAAFIEVARNLSEDAAFLLAASRAARSVVQVRFDADKMIDAYTNCYSRLHNAQSEA